MSTRVFFLPVGTPVSFSTGVLPYSVCAQPGLAGKVLIEYSADGRTFYPSAPGLLARPYSFNTQTALGGIGGYGLAQVGSNASPNAAIRATAYTAAGVLTCSDLSLPSPYGAQKSILAQSGVAYACQNVNTEQTLWSMRLHPGFFLQDYASWALELEVWASVDASADARTLSVHYGPTAFAPSTGLEGGTLLHAIDLTSKAGYAGRFGVAGRNDGQKVIAQTAGADFGGWGSTTAAQVALVNTNYLGYGAVEQVLSVTATAATSNGSVASGIILDRVAVRYVQ